MKGPVDVYVHMGNRRAPRTFQLGGKGDKKKEGGKGGSYNSIDYIEKKKVGPESNPI